jgi:hypothetical protein
LWLFDLLGLTDLFGIYRPSPAVTAIIFQGSYPGLTEMLLLGCFYATTFANINIINVRRVTEMAAFR